MRAIFEAGIGCDRALVIDNGGVVEAHLELPGARVGDVWEARLWDMTRRVGDLQMPGGPRLDPVPDWATEGMILEVEVMREAIHEPDRFRPPLVTARGPASEGASARVGEAPRRSGYATYNTEGGGYRLRAGPGLRERLVARGIRVANQTAHGPDLLESAGWSEVLDEARTGVVDFEGGALRIERTAAFETIDIDGHWPPPQLALVAAPIVAAAIRRFDITGAIVIDFPTVGDRALRQRVDALLEASLPPPFERTAMNGFGLVQVIRPKARRSLMDHMQAAPEHMAALTLLRQAERTAGAGTTLLTANPAVTRLIGLDMLAELERRTGRPARLHADPVLAISGGHVHVQP